VRATPALTAIARRAVVKLASFTDETSQPLRFTQSGALKIARNEGDAAQLGREVQRGREVGVAIDFVSTAEARRRLPILRERGIAAVTWSPTDCNVEPSELPIGYCRAAEKMGAVLLPNTPATGFEIRRCRRRRRTATSARAWCRRRGAWSRLVAETSARRCRSRDAPSASSPSRSRASPSSRRAGSMRTSTFATSAAAHARWLRVRSAAGRCGDAAGVRDGRAAADIEVLRRLPRVAEQSRFSGLGIQIAEHRGGPPTITTDDRYPSAATRRRGVDERLLCGRPRSPALARALEWIVDGSRLDLVEISTARFARDRRA
jgi:4-methylaminobutanoate oxidase (formaldehyde-forming)